MILPLPILAISNQRDKELIETLYLNHRHAMYRVAYGILKNRHDAEDAINDACISLIKHVEKLRSLNESEQYFYIQTTIRNTSINRYNKLTREGRHAFLHGEMEMLGQQDKASAVDSRIIQEAEIDSLVGALASLPPQELMLLRMRYLNDMTDVEVAKALSIKPSTVRSALTKARRRAKLLLGEVRPT